MGLEAATYVQDLLSSNPVSNDAVSQGDDHIRLIKTVLKTTFPVATKPFYFPRGANKTTNYNVLATDDKTLFVVDTTAASLALNLPTLAAGDAGWSIEVIKTNVSANYIALQPPLGGTTINGFSFVRRAQENTITKIIWTGSTYIASRPNGGNVGQLRWFAGATLPSDCLWPDGTTFAQADFPELFAALGNSNVKPDVRGRVFAAKDNLGGVAANKIGTVVTDSGTIVGSTLWSVGGSSTHTQVSTEMPQHTHTFAGDALAGHTHKAGQNSMSNSPPGSVGTVLFGTGDHANATITDSVSAGTPTGTNSTFPTSPATAMAWLQPTIIMNVGLVAE